MKSNRVRKSCLKKTAASGESSSDIITSADSCNSSSTGTTSASSASSKLSWGALEIRTYPNILGDNPAVSDGCPITLDWRPISREKHDDLVYYEITVRTRRPRRRRKELVMKVIERDT
jgi:hypothetical protein